MLKLNHTYNLLGSPLTKWLNKPIANNDALWHQISTIKKIEPNQLGLVNGEWQALINLIEIHCPNPTDVVAFFEPSRKLYKKASAILNKPFIEIKLNEQFEIDTIVLENLLTPNCKILFINYPNNPTGNCFNRDDIYFILNNFNGLVVIDEAYINYSQQKSFLQDIVDYPNLIVLQSFNYAWGLAGLNVALIAGNENLMTKHKLLSGKNSINYPTAQVLQEALSNLHQVNAMITETIDLKKAFETVLLKFGFVEKIYPSQAHFVLVKFSDAEAIYKHLLQQNIDVKNCTQAYGCHNCLRISIGTEQQITMLVDALIAFNNILFEQ